MRTSRASQGNKPETAPTSAVSRAGRGGHKSRVHTRPRDALGSGHSTARVRTGHATASLAIGSGSPRQPHRQISGGTRSKSRLSPARRLTLSSSITNKRFQFYPEQKRHREKTHVRSGLLGVRQDKARPRQRTVFPSSRSQASGAFGTVFRLLLRVTVR